MIQLVQTIFSHDIGITMTFPCQLPITPKIS